MFGEFTTQKINCLLGERKTQLFKSISDMLQEDVIKSDIVTSIKTNHLAITLENDMLDEQQRSHSFWKFNNSLVEHPVFIQSLREKFQIGFKKSIFF